MFNKKNFQKKYIVEWALTQLCIIREVSLNIHRHFQEYAFKVPNMHNKMS